MRPVRITSVGQPGTSNYIGEGEPDADRGRVGDTYINTATGEGWTKTVDGWEQDFGPVFGAQIAAVQAAVATGLRVMAATTTGGTANAIVATTPYAADSSSVIILRPTAANTSTGPTVAFNGGSALTIKTVTGAALPAGALASGMDVVGRVNGSDFRLLSDYSQTSVNEALVAEVTALVEDADEQVDLATAQRVLAETARTGAETARDLAETYAGVTHRAATWAALAAISGTTGQLGYVGPADTGTHTDPVAGGTVANEGVYRWEANGLGSAQARRVGSTGLASLSTAVAALHYADPQNVTIPVSRRFGAISGSANILQTDWNQFSWVSGTGTFIYQFFLSKEDIVERDAGRPITIRLPATGTFSDTPDIQQFNAGGTSIDSRTDMTWDAAAGEFVRTLTLDAACTAIRYRGSGTSAFTIGRPYVLYQGQRRVAATEAGWLRQVDIWAQEIARSTGDLWGACSFAAGVGSLGDMSPDGRVLSIPSASRMDITFYCHGALTPADDYTLVCELLETTAFNVLAVTGTPNTGFAAGGGVMNDALEQVGRLIFIRGQAAGAGGANAAYITFAVDTRAAAAGSIFPAAAAKLRVHALLKGRHESRKLTDIAALRRALANRAAQDAVVDALCPSNADNHYTTLEAAYCGGHRRIRLAGSQSYALPAGLAIQRDVSIEWAAQASGETMPVIHTGRTIAEGEWTATAADPNVKFLALTYDPARVWEVSAAGVETRMGVVGASGKPVEAANEAAVSANVGGWWYGAGTEGTGIYQRPFGDTLTGKTWIIPINHSAAGSVLTLRGATVDLAMIDLRYGLGHTVLVQAGATLNSDGIIVGRSGTNGAQFDAGTRWNDLKRPSLATDAGNDGWGNNGTVAAPVVWRLSGTEATDNISDGFAPHGTFTDVWTGLPIRAWNNGKQGFVSITAGRYHLNIVAWGNYDVDCLFQLGSAAAASVITGDLWRVGSSAISHNTAGSVTGRIERIESRASVASRALFNTNVNVDVGTLIANGNNGAGGVLGGEAYRRTAGTGTLENVRVNRFAGGVRLDAGTLNLRSGHILRCTTGLHQTGGTLNLDANDPLNLFGNTTTFNGVSAPDQAKTVAVAAVF